MEGNKLKRHMDFNSSSHKAMGSIEVNFFSKDMANKIMGGRFGIERGRDEGSSRGNGLTEQ
jgi:hypothetical protein